jgi:hypothetical protein
MINRTLAYQDTGQITADCQRFIRFNAGIVGDVCIAFSFTLQSDTVIKRSNSLGNPEHFAQLL